MDVMGLDGSVMVPVPLTRVQVPVAGEMMALPAMVAVPLVVQSDWSGPASAAGVPKSNTRTVTSSVVTPEGQGPLSTDQLKT